MLKGRNRRGGQALVELLPSLVIFLMVLSAALAYFRIMRAATIREEVVRNMAFAKINNSGTLTTPVNQNNPQGIIIGDIPSISQSSNTFVGQGDGCFSVSPSKASQVLPMPAKVYGAGTLTPVTVLTYAVVYRYPGSGCSY